MYQKMAVWIKATGEDDEVTAEKCVCYCLSGFVAIRVLALPLIALQYHEVKLKVTFETAANLAVTALTTPIQHLRCGPTTSTWIPMSVVALHRFRTNTLLNSSSISLSIRIYWKLNFNHPVKELIWAGKRASTSIHGGPSNPMDLQTSASVKLADDTSTTVTLKLTATNVLLIARTITLCVCSRGNSTVNQVAVLRRMRSTYGAIHLPKPEEHQPSGTCNYLALIMLSSFTTPLWLAPKLQTVSTSMLSTTTSSVS